MRIVNTLDSGLRVIAREADITCFEREALEPVLGVELDKRFTHYAVCANEIEQTLDLFAVENTL